MDCAEKMKIGILTSHPIQYQIPLFRTLSKRVDLRVYFMHKATPKDQSEAGFDCEFDWDIDLFDGYEHVFLKNRAKKPRLNRFFGCDTPDIKEHIAKEHFDAFVVLGWHLKSYWQAVRACHHMKIPVVIRGDSKLGTHTFPLKRALKEIYTRIMINQFDGFLTVGQKNREYLLHYGAEEERLEFSPHFVENNWFKERSELSSKQADELRATFGASKETVLLLFVGKFIRVKRPLDVVQALKRLKDKGIRALGVFVGAGELEQAIRDLAAELEVQIHMAGFKNQTELPPYYGVCDLCILPSGKNETWGLVVNESIASGTPAIVSDQVGCAPDMIEEGLTGYVCHVGNAEEMANAVGAMIPRINGDLVKEALRKKTEIYSVNNAADALERVVKKIKGDLGIKTKKLAW